MVNICLCYIVALCIDVLCVGIAIAKMNDINIF